MRRQFPPEFRQRALRLLDKANPEYESKLCATPSTGTVGDSYDSALAEAVNGLYKTEMIRHPGPWRTVEQVELATAEYVWWWNNQRLHSELGYRTPAEVETEYYADLESPVMATASHGKP
jgi:putative transposase